MIGAQPGQAAFELGVGEGQLLFSPLCRTFRRSSSETLLRLCWW